MWGGGSRRPRGVSPSLFPDGEVRCGEGGLGTVTRGCVREARTVGLDVRRTEEVGDVSENGDGPYG